jgi:hypothetical protein
MSKKFWISATLALACGAGLAKIPVPVLDAAAQAKAGEAAAKTAWQSRIGAFELCRVQDRVAAYYRSHAGSQAGKTAPVPATAAGPTAAGPIVPGSRVAANPAIAGGTAAKPAGPATPTGCADPGPFAYNAPSEKPLETSGAHSPAGNATSPPSVRATSAEMAPAKK